MGRYFPWLPVRVAKATVKTFSNGRQSLRSRTVRELLLMPRNNHYDIIHCQFGKLGPPVLELRRIGAIHGKLVTSFRGYDATVLIDKYPGFYDQLFKEGDLFLPVSASLKKRLIEAGCDPSRIHIHRSGIDCSRFSLAESRISNDGPVRLISVARLIEKKGLNYAIEAIAGVRRLGRRVEYTIVGDGRLRSRLEQQVKDLGLTDEVQLIGWRSHDEVVRLLNLSDVLIAPSVTANGDQEGIPNALKEAMAMGLPVIGTHHGGITELIDDGVSGFLVPERDVEALVNKLCFFIDHPKDWEEMGRRGSAKVRKNYDIGMLNDRLVELYRTV